MAELCEYYIARTVSIFERKKKHAFYYSLKLIKFKSIYFLKKQNSKGECCLSIEVLYKWLRYILR